MNWLEMSDDEIMAIATPIMDNLMQASTNIDHERHIRDFSDNMKAIVTRENLERQCREYGAIALSALDAKTFSPFFAAAGKIIGSLETMPNFKNRISAN